MAFLIVIAHLNLNVIEARCAFDAGVEIINVYLQFVFAEVDCFSRYGIGDPGEVVHDELSAGGARVNGEELVVNEYVKLIRLRVVVQLHAQGNAG